MTLQDGGFLRNGPSFEALKESWAISSARRGCPYNVFDPDHVVSVGTDRFLGENADEVPEACITDDRWVEYRRAWNSGGFGQTCGFLKKQLDGHTDWQEFLTANPGLDRRGLCFRFDVETSSPLPRLDNTRAMYALKELAAKTFDLSPSLDHFIAYSIGRMFYLHLLDASDVAGEYIFRGHVLCRWTVDQPGYGDFRRRVSIARFEVVVPGGRGEALRPNQYRNLYCPVSVRRRDLLRLISI